MERSKAGTKQQASTKQQEGTKQQAGTSPDGLSHPNQNIIIIIKILLLFYKIWKKNNEIQSTKNKMDLNN